MGVGPYLAIETSTPLGSVAVGRGDKLLAAAVMGVVVRHSESLLPAVDFVLRSASMRPKDIAGVVVGGGPGSFTGVRIAAATAKALVRVLGVPLFAFSGLAALAAVVGAEGRPVCGLFDARRGEVYAGCYRFPGFASIETVLPPGGWRMPELLEELGARVAEPAIFAGSAALSHQRRIQAAGGSVAPAHLSVPSATALLWLADVAPEQGRVAAPAEWQPLYVRGWSAERGVEG
ncbi:MAG: tRNA (adenosine(37)-N6)-threonylcarbamoyltransferase complex dimerization subunit type 1 TsaB [Gemmatimonadetes bacterium]|nr:tRNA (adenosine(37)-N6)-threonylcarbamoyltransferase complex dimerization subunit type 1 TsaB [Gemmatimonadota bacterium]